MSLDDDDCMIKLDANIEIETYVVNRFEDDQNINSLPTLTTAYNVTHPFSGKYIIADELNSYKESASNINESSEQKGNVSALSDISAESGDSVNLDDSSKTFLTKTKNNYLKNVNVKERIVFCLDLSLEMNEFPFFAKSNQLSSSSMIKRAVSIFVQNKHFLHDQHEYALMIMYDTAIWILDFTSDCRKFIETLSKLPEVRECNSCDITSILSLLIKKYPEILCCNPVDVQCVYRVIFLYGRSKCTVHLSNPSVKNLILDSPLFYFDVLYIHEPQSDENKCMEIFEFFCNLDDHEKSYIFEMTRSVSVLHNFMGKLLSHPFQRALQSDTDYKLQDFVPTNC